MKQNIVIDTDPENFSGNDEKNLFYLYMLTALSCIGGFLFGYDTGVISGALVLLKDEFNLTDTEQELVVGLAVAGALVAALSSGYLTDKFGRRPIIISSCVIFSVGAILLSVAQDVPTLFIGRFIVGLGVGIASGIFPVYVSECAPAAMRGTLVTTVNVAITFGQFFSSCLDALFVRVPHGWRYMLGFGALPAILQFIGFVLYMPESPRWLIEHKIIDKATLALQKLRNKFDVREEIQEIMLSFNNPSYNPSKSSPGQGLKNGSEASTSLLSRSPDPSANNQSSCSPDNSSVNNVFNTTARQEYLDDSSSSSCTSMFNAIQEPTVKRALLLGCMLQAAQQFCGINTVMYYSATILALAGFGSDLEVCLWLTAAVSFCNFAGSCCGLYLVDSLGRRSLTLYSLAGVSLFLALLSVSFYLAQSMSAKSSTAAMDIISGSCGGYSYCFDCVQDDSCGFCSSITGGFGSGCIPADGSHASNSSQCDANSYTGSSCPGGSSSYGWMIFVALCCYLLAFAPGMGAMPWTITSEIFPTSVRGVCNSITTTTNWGSNLIMSLTFLTIAKTASKQGAFGLYAGVAGMFFIFFFFYLPETKDLPLEDIQDLFSDSTWGTSLRKYTRMTSYSLYLRESSNERPSHVYLLTDNADNDRSQSYRSSAFSSIFDRNRDPSNPYSTDKLDRKFQAKPYPIDSNRHGSHNNHTINANYTENPMSSPSISPSNSSTSNDWGFGRSMTGSSVGSGRDLEYQAHSNSLNKSEIWKIFRRGDKSRLNQKDELFISHSIPVRSSFSSPVKLSSSLPTGIGQMNALQLNHKPPATDEDISRYIKEDDHQVKAPSVEI